nr:MAG TPA: hypothetical protein [Caudoviricetes sp.]
MKDMELLLFLSFFGIVAICGGIWGAIQLHKESKAEHK